MKTNIFYFSSTGNNLAIARDIAAKLPETRIYPISRAIAGPDLEADNIGLVFPVYYAGVPRLVSRFIEKLSLAKDKYIFAVCSCGGIPMGALFQVQWELQAQGRDLQAGFAVPMPGNYIVRYSAFSVKKQAQLFAAKEKKIESIVQAVARQARNKLEGNGPVLNYLGDILHKRMRAKFPQLDRNFTISDQCGECQTCAMVCPVQNISIVNGKPRWQGNCEHCLACLQWCPVTAIQYGAQTQKRKRYRYPGIIAQDLYRE